MLSPWMDSHIARLWDSAANARSATGNVSVHYAACLQRGLAVKRISNEVSDLGSNTCWTDGERKGAQRLHDKLSHLGFLRRMLDEISLPYALNKPSQIRISLDYR